MWRVRNRANVRYLFSAIFAHLLRISTQGRIIAAAWQTNTLCVLIKQPLKRLPQFKSTTAGNVTNSLRLTFANGRDATRRLECENTNPQDRLKDVSNPLRFCRATVTCEMVISLWSTAVRWWAPDQHPFQVTESNAPDLHIYTIRWWVTASQTAKSRPYSEMTDYSNLWLCKCMSALWIRQNSSLRIWPRLFASIFYCTVIPLLTSMIPTII